MLKCSSQHAEFRGLTGVRHSEPGSRVHDVTASIGASFVPIVMRFSRQQVGQCEDVAHKPDQQDGHDDLKEKNSVLFLSSWSGTFGSC